MTKGGDVQSAPALQQLEVPEHGLNYCTNLITNHSDEWRKKCA